MLPYGRVHLIPKGGHTRHKIYTRGLTGIIKKGMAPQIPGKNATEKGGT